MENFIGVGEMNVAAPQRGQPVEDFDSGGHGDRHRRKGEEGIWAGSHADGEHVVRPDAEADKADADRCRDHGGITEDGLA